MKRLVITAAAASTILLGAASIAMADDGQPEQPQQPEPAQQPEQPGFGPAAIREQIQTQFQDRMENARNNQDYRNQLMSREDASGTIDRQLAPGFNPGGSMIPAGGHEGERGFGSSSPRGFEDHYASSSNDFPPFMTPFIHRFASSTDFASSTFRQRADEARGRDREMRADMFAWIQNNLVDQLDRALGNLKQIRSRISDRIQTEAAAGRDMSQAQSLLAVADQKLAAANTAIQAVAGYQPSATSTASVTASTTVGVGQARTLGGDAIQAVKDARDALGQVVIAIAHAMGLGIDEASTTQSTSTDSSTTTGQ